MPDFPGIVQIQDGGGATTIVLNGDNGDLTVGGNSQDGQLVVATGAGREVFKFDSSSAALYLGGEAGEGDLVVRDATNAERIKLDGGQGDIWVKDAAGNLLFHFNTANAGLFVGGQTNEGDVVVRDAANVERIQLDGGQGDIWVKDAAGNTLFHFNSANAGLFVGGQTSEGDVVVRDATNLERVKLDGGEGDIWVKDAAGNTLFHFNSGNAALFVGGKDNEGDVVVRDAANVDRIQLDAGQGDIWVKDAAGNALFHFNSGNAALFVGGKDVEGDIVVRDADQKERIKLDAGGGDIIVRSGNGDVHFHFDGANGTLLVGGQFKSGDVVARDAANRQRVKLDGAEGDIWVKDANGHLLFHFDSANAGLFVGGQDREGDVIVRDEANRERVMLDGGGGDIRVRDANGNLQLHFDGATAGLWVGGQGTEGDVIVRDEANRERIKLDGGEGDIWVKNTAGNLLFHFDSEFAALYLGGVGNEGDLIVRNGDGNQTIKLDGAAGDIILNNADAAEDFEIANAEQVSPGMVMVLAEDGTLEPCSQAYDQKVVGVVSGAGRYKPGIVFDRGASPDPRRAPISMMGKVACRADASYGRIGIGDMLTTSPSPGRAMKVSDPTRAFGSVIGKALTPLDDGEGLVTMLISLQ